MMDDRYWNLDAGYSILDTGYSAEWVRNDKVKSAIERV